MSPENLRRLTLLAAAMRAHDAVLAATSCAHCGQPWLLEGEEGEPCARALACGDTRFRAAACPAAERAQLDAQRQMLLWPDFGDEHSPRYDALDETDRAVWDTTRGCTGEGSEIAWARRLRRAVESGLVTRAEADAALGRLARRSTA